MPVNNRFMIIQKTTLAPGCYDIVLHAPEVAAAAQVGQFVQVKVDGFFLRRPISICEIDSNEGNIRLVFEIRGKGTAELAKPEVGDFLDLIAPLGNGFTLLDPTKKAVVIGGGIGVPPLFAVAKHYGKNCAALLGFRSADKIILMRQFAELGCDTRLATDDGSFGFHGFTTQLLEQYLMKNTPDILYACGPMAMLKGIAAIAREKGIRLEVSLEERMACGVGACLTCACEVLRENGEATYQHVCKDGPVFESEAIFHG